MSLIWLVAYFHPSQRVACRGLLRFLLALAGAPAELTLAEPDRDLEDLVVVRARRRGRFVSRRRLVPLLKNFLQPALVIRLEQAPVPFRVPPADELRRRLVAAVEVDRPDQRLHRVGEKALPRAAAGVFLADAEVAITSDPQL